MQEQEALAKVNLHPITPVYIGKQPPEDSKAIIHIYDHESYRVIEGFQDGAIEEALLLGKNVWVDIVGLADNVRISKLAAELFIHPLVVEDILHIGQRSKLDIFDGYLFIVFQLLDRPKSGLTYATEQFSMIIKKNVLLTVRETDGYDVTSFYRRLSADASLIREHGIDYLTYVVLDRVIDNYFDFVDAAGDALEKMEDLLINKPEEINLKELYTIKRRTLTLHRTIAPIRDIVHLLLGEHEGIISFKYRLYYRDLHDHTIRLLETVDLHHQMTAGMLDIYLSTLNNRLNETMKILTLFASMFIPLTFIVGVYGMNFEYMPELKWHYAYPTLMIMLLFIATTMFFYFKRKKLI